MNPKRLVPESLFGHGKPVFRFCTNGRPLQTFRIRRFAAPRCDGQVRRHQVSQPPLMRPALAILFFFRCSNLPAGDLEPSVFPGFIPVLHLAVPCHFQGAGGIRMMKAHQTVCVAAA